MKKLTGFAVITDSVGKRIAYTYTTLSKDGVVTDSNAKESFVVIDDDTLDLISKLEDKVNLRLA